MSAIDVVPPSHVMASTETHPLAFDFSANLLEGETLTSPSATLTDTTTGEAFEDGLSGTPAVAGALVTQKVTGLSSGTDYVLSVTVTAAVGKVWTQRLTIKCQN